MINTIENGRYDKMKGQYLHNFNMCCANKGKKFVITDWLHDCHLHNRLTFRYALEREFGLHSIRDRFFSVNLFKCLWNVAHSLYLVTILMFVSIYLRLFCVDSNIDTIGFDVSNRRCQGKLTGFSLSASVKQIFVLQYIGRRRNGELSLKTDFIPYSMPNSCQSHSRCISLV